VGSKGRFGVEEVGDAFGEFKKSCFGGDK